MQETAITPAAEGNEESKEPGHLGMPTGISGEGMAAAEHRPVMSALSATLREKKPARGR